MAIFHGESWMCKPVDPWPSWRMSRARVAWVLVPILGFMVVFEQKNNIYSILLSTHQINYPPTSLSLNRALRTLDFLILCISHKSVSWSKIKTSWELPHSMFEVKRSNSFFFLGSNWLNGGESRERGWLLRIFWVRRGEECRVSTYTEPKEPVIKVDVWPKGRRLACAKYN